MAEATMRFRAPKEAVRRLGPGVAISVLVAVAAQFIAEHYGAPAMLMALLLGAAVSFLGEEGRTVDGVSFAAKGLLRLGVALLGVRISADLIADLGLELIGLVVLAVIATIGFGLAIARLFGQTWRFALLTAGSVAICGASAAMAISAILPQDKNGEQQLTFTVIGVTVLSTIAMILYPVIVGAFALDDRAGGVFLGGAIHDVAQVIGAGYSISESTGDAAALVKLMRVSLLAPVVLVAALIIRAVAEAPTGDRRPPLLPSFVVGFLVLAGLNSFHLLPELLVSTLSDGSRWLLLIAIAAVGVKTNLKRVLAVGGSAIGLLVAETLFIGGFILAGLHLLG